VHDLAEAAGAAFPHIVRLSLSMLSTHSHLITQKQERLMPMAFAMSFVYSALTFALT
jgi:hypothetical protein